jgi:hypothetical protein
MLDLTETETNKQMHFLGKTAQFSVIYLVYISAPLGRFQGDSSNYKKDTALHI